MKKFFTILISLIFIFLISIASALLTIGIETERFNKLILNKINQIDNKINVKINTIKFKLDISEFSLFLETSEPNIFYRDISIPTKKIKVYVDFLSIIKTKPKIKRTMWSRRDQEYDQKINSGKIYELAEVVKDLNKNTDIIADQSYSERQLFEKAYERLKSEFEAVLKINPEDVKKKMDKALGRMNISEEAQ